MCRTVLAAACKLLLLAASLSATAGQGIAADGDDEALRKASVSNTAKDWLALLNSWCGDEKELAKLEKYIADVGSDSFDDRAAASSTLTRLGPAAVPLLLAAMRTNDLETERRVHACLKRINQGWKPDVRGSVVDRVIDMNTDEAFEALLRYLPWSGHDEVVDDIVFHLYDRAKERPSLRVSLRRALTDPVSLRRGAAACIMARLGTEADRGVVRRLLPDRSPIVRLRAAQGLLAAKDSSGIPTLIELLLEPAVDISWQAEELLHWAATTNSPVATVGAATHRERRTCRNAWYRWWQQRHGMLDWRTIDADPRRPILLLMYNVPTFRQLNRQNGQRLSVGKSQIWLCGCDGRERWSMPACEVTAFQLLPGNCLFVNQECPARTPGSDTIAIKHADVVDLYGNLLSYPNSLAMELVPYAKPLGFDREITLGHGNELHLERYRLQERSPDNRVQSEIPMRQRAVGFSRCLPLVALAFDRPRPKNLDLLADLNRHRARLRSKDLFGCAWQLPIFRTHYRTTKPRYSRRNSLT